jgi:glycosyltransferase involved in cell wall biosynthesis
MAGRQEHPEVFYRAADILAFPSQEETFGNVLVEAMAHGLAVVSTRVGVAVDCLRHGDNALLVPRAEPAELARAIDRLIRDVALRERLGRAARREVVERFAPAPIARRHLELYGLLDARLAAGGGS